MAPIKGKYLRGLVGPVTFRVHKSTQIVSSKAKNVKQTRGTKLHQVKFGDASSFSSMIRSSFAYSNNGFEDGTAANRLSHELYQSLKTSFNVETGLYEFEEDSFDGLSNFNFNINSSFRMSLMVKPTIKIESGKLTVAFPEYKTSAKIVFPKKATFCEVIVDIAFYRLGDGQMVCMPVDSTIRIEKAQEVVAAQELTFEAPNNCLCIVGLFVHFYYEYIYPTLMNNKTFHPSGIYKAIFIPGVFEDTGKYVWEKMSSKQKVFSLG